MTSLTIELEDKVYDAVVKAAEREGDPLMDWIQNHLAIASHTSENWPEGYFETIASFDADCIEEPEEVKMPLDRIQIQ